MLRRHLNYCLVKENIECNVLSYCCCACGAATSSSDYLTHVTTSLVLHSKLYTQQGASQSQIVKTNNSSSNCSQVFYSSFWVAIRRSNRIMKSSSSSLPSPTMNEPKSHPKWIAWISFLSVTIASLLIANVPVEYALPSKYILPQPTQEADVTSGGSYNDEEVMMTSGLTVTYGSLGFPLVLSPHDHNSNFDTIDQLCQWVASHEEWITEKMYIHGAVLFRGFADALVTPSDFQQFALTLEPHLEKSYLGTSTRTVQEGTPYVHSASDYDGWRIIPAHLEMSFLPTLPARIFFFAHAPNQGVGGETPLVDFRQVYRDLVDEHPELVDAFKQRRIQYIRKYHDNTQGPCYDYFIHKDWQPMFNTTNATLAGERAVQSGFDWSFDHAEETTWGTTSYKGTMKLVHTLSPTRIHPHTQDEIWSNHMNVLHVDSIPAEFAYSAQHLRSWKYVCLYYGFELLVLFQKHVVHGGKASEMGHHVTHQDGSEMNSEYVNTIKQTVWKNTIVYKHQKGDVALLDNYRVAHGRQPYKGARSILTAWH